MRTESESYNHSIATNPLDVSTKDVVYAQQPVARSEREWHPRGRHLINYAERVLTWLRRFQRITPAPGIVKVNLGSGLYVAPGWINVDGSLKTALAGWPRPLLRLVYPLMSNCSHSCEEFTELLHSNIFVNHNLQYGVPLPSDSTDYIFTSHVIHHLYKDQAHRLLTDIRRVLKPGGTLRVAVPNLEFIIELYLQGQRERAIEKYFFYPSASRSDLSTHYQYDYVLLKQLLESAGFNNVRRYRCYEGNTPDLDKLDRLSDETLFVEAEKQVNVVMNRAVDSGMENPLAHFQHSRDDTSPTVDFRWSTSQSS
jgi:predicted SAM-dependent methyltransferase